MSNDDVVNSRNDPEAEEEERDLSQLLDKEARPEMVPKEEICEWPELQEQIKGDLEHAYKWHAPASQINQLLILQNFANLRMKGLRRIAASEEIARQWHEGQGVGFARHVRMLAHHYQLYEQLPVEKRGGDTGRSLLNDEHVQTTQQGHI
jgi:hypothetical protein